MRGKEKKGKNNNNNKHNKPKKANDKPCTAAIQQDITDHGIIVQKYDNCQGLTIAPTKLESRFPGELGRKNLYIAENS